MKKTLILILFAIFGCVYVPHLQAQSTCAPVLGYNNTYDLCANTGTLDLTVSVGIPSGCAHANTVTPFNWQGPSAPGLLDDNNISITNPDAGNYSVQINLVQSGVAGSVPCPCIGSHTSNIVAINEVPTIPNVTSDTIICGGSTILTAVQPLGANGTGYFNWYDNANNLLFSGNSYVTNVLNSTTGYKVSYVENGCESDLRSFSVIVNPIPQPILPYDSVNINCNNNFTLTATSPSGGVINWFSDMALSNLIHIGSQFTTPDLLLTKTYYLVNVNGSCSSASESVTVKTIQTPAPMVSSFESCAGEELVLTANHGGGGLGSGLFEWYDNSNILLHSGIQFVLPQSYTSAPGVFSLFVLENINGCQSTLSVQNVEINPLPNISLDTNFVKICEEASFQLAASSSFDPNVSYHWTTPNSTIFNTDLISFTNASKADHEGSYYVYNIDNSTGCISETVSTFVQVVSAPNLGLLPEYKIIDGNSLQLIVSGADSYLWSPAELFDNNEIPNPVFTPFSLLSNQEELIIVTVIGEDFDNQCISTAQTNILIQPFGLEAELPIKVYDVFTPNGDDFNDFWYIDYLYNLTVYEISVYDKSNKIVYYHNSADGSYEEHKWNGGLANDESAILPTGTYRYVIHAPGSETVEPLRGQVTLLH